MVAPAGMRLYLDPRSSASLRVLCCVAYKGLDIPVTPVALIRDEHQGPAHRALNPARTVPVLDTGRGAPVTQSLAILELLEELYPAPATLPADPYERAQARSLCGLVAADIHPITNRRVRKYVDAAQAGQGGSATWCRHWTEEGLRAVEAMLARRPRATRYACADTPGMADFCLAPQVLNGLRFGCALAEFPLSVGIYEACLAHPAFAAVAAAR